MGTLYREVLGELMIRYDRILKLLEGESEAYIL